MATLPEDASVEELALQRAMLTSWTPQPPEKLTRRQLEKKAGRRLSATTSPARRARHAGADRQGVRRDAQPRGGLDLLDLDIPRTA